MIHYYQQPWELDDNQCALINKAYDDRLLEPFVKEKNLFRLSFENRNGKWYNPEVQSGLIAYPHNRLVPDTYMTQEVWIMIRVQVECVAEIHIWYDATGIPNYFSAEELPVRMELINCAEGDRGWILDSLFDHPDYTLPMYENENRNFNYDI